MNKLQKTLKLIKQISGSPNDPENVYFSISSSNNQKSFASPRHMELDLSRSLLKENQTICTGAYKEEDCPIFDESINSGKGNENVHRLIKTLKVSSKRKNKTLKVSRFTTN
jgi:hypothetical protein